MFDLVLLPSSVDVNHSNVLELGPGLEFKPFRQALLDMQLMLLACFRQAFPFVSASACERELNIKSEAAFVF